MKKFFSSLVLVVSLLALIGCNNGLNEKVEENGGEVGLNDNVSETQGAEIGLNSLSPETQVAVRKFGKVSRVYKAPVRERFYTGQVVTQDHFGMKLYFEAFVVEFDKLDSYIANYLNSISGDSSNNALMHQNYGEINFDTNKTYVEFATYKIYDPNKDVNNMKVFRYETRTFSGDYINHLVWGNNGKYPEWYAKSVDFDPSMEIDLTHRKYIDPAKRNEQVNYEFPYETVSLGIKSINNTVDFNKYGKVTNVYQNKYAGVPTDYYLVEFSNVDENFKDFIRYNDRNNGDEWIHDQNFKKPGTEELINYNDAYFIEFYEQTEKDDEKFASKFWFREKRGNGHSPICVLSKEELSKIDKFSIKTNLVEVNDPICPLFNKLGKNTVYQNVITLENNNIIKDNTYLIVYNQFEGKEIFGQYFRTKGKWYNSKFKNIYKIGNKDYPTYKSDDQNVYFECEPLNDGTYKIRFLNVFTDGSSVYEKVFTKEEFEKLSSLQKINGLEYYLGEGIVWEGSNESKNVKIKINSYKDKTIELTINNQIITNYYINDGEYALWFDKIGDTNNYNFHIFLINGGQEENVLRICNNSNNQSNNVEVIVRKI